MVPLESIETDDKHNLSIGFVVLDAEGKMKNIVTRKANDEAQKFESSSSLRYALHIFDAAAFIYHPYW